MTIEYRLKCIALHGTPAVEEKVMGWGKGLEALDERACALARVAALVSVGGSATSYGEIVDSAIAAGATPAEIGDVLLGISNIVGVPRVVEAAPKLALALGFVLDEFVEE